MFNAHAFLSDYVCTLQTDANLRACKTYILRIYDNIIPTQVDKN